jgi:hypothetical protein
VKQSAHYPQTHLETTIAVSSNELPYFTHMNKERSLNSGDFIGDFTKVLGDYLAMDLV